MNTHMEQYGPQMANHIPKIMHASRDAWAFLEECATKPDMPKLMVLPGERFSVIITDSRDIIEGVQETVGGPPVSDD